MVTRTVIGCVHSLHFFACNSQLLLQSFLINLIDVNLGMAMDNEVVMATCNQLFDFGIMSCQ
jgi:hypothetical protein